jgi:DNA polymerase/3'-5' exonuclease PolX
MSIQNPDVAQIFKKMADPLEIEGESRYKIKAYRYAARTVGGRSRTATLARG